MNILIFEWNNFGVSDVCEALQNIGSSSHVVSTELMLDRVSPAFDALFDKEYGTGIYDAVFTFNYSPVVSNNCSRCNIPYIAFVYDSPLVTLYSYTIINPCNYVFIFDKALYMDLKKENIPTVYYMPLAVNFRRIQKLITESKPNTQESASHAKINPCDISFVGSMYNEQHNLFERFKNLPDFTKGYLDAAMDAQLQVYGYYFIEELLTPQILEAMQNIVPLQPNRDGVETISYLYAYYYIARKLAATERQQILSKVSQHFNTYLYTPNATPEIPHIHNMGTADYMTEMPLVFANSKINLNITLRSIRSGIPLRAMDIMGAGGFLMSNYQADFYDFFIPGEDMILYESQDDLLNKCDYYLRHDSERRQIAQNGFEKVKERHTFEVRLKEIFEIVFQ